MLGDDLLVAPVVEEGITSRAVYLPAGTRWQEVSTGKWYDGGFTVQAVAELDTIPLFLRENASLQRTVFSLLFKD